MARIVDRRLDGKNKSAVNRKRLLRRYKQQIRKAVAEAVGKRSITDTDKGENINIPAKDISEPQITIGRGGVREQVMPGNEEWSRGDKIKRSECGAGKGGPAASNEGEGEDDFTFEISRAEYLDILFQELALPDLVKIKMVEQSSYKPVRAGFSNTGVPANLNLIRTMRRAKGRRRAMKRSYETEFDAVEQELLAEESKPDHDMIKARRLKDELNRLTKKIQAVPFLDDYDLRFNQFTRQPKPVARAVMFCIMDVSGSMTVSVKDIAKRFFILLYLFLNRSYEKTEVVFIRHHTIAKEVDEQEFFYSRETGGTVVSSALTLCNDIITERYPSEDWNIYVAQASDGDNWGEDNQICQDILVNRIMAKLQYFAYVEINAGQHQSLWEHYENVAEQYDSFAMKHIESVEDIYPVFHELFKRKDLVAWGS